MKFSNLKAPVVLFGGIVLMALLFESTKSYWGTGVAVGILVLFGFGLSVALTSFLLSPLSQTNHLLERLMRETLHELNAPLATIKTNTQLLKKEFTDPKSSRRLERILEASANLYSLYTQMEYYIKREIRLVKDEIFDAKEAIERCIARCNGMQKEILLSCNLDSVMVKTDPIGFEQTLTNLLSNAYKYNHPQGWVAISLRDNTLQIQDGGIGMDEQTLFRIFDRHYQANSAIEGYGLGLSIVKSYCDNAGIFISFVSKKGEGTTVSLHLEHILAKAV